MPINRLLTAAAAVALAAGLSAGASAQTTATAKTEAQAKAATGKASTDAPAHTAVQGTAKAVKEGAAPAAAVGVNAQATTPAAPASAGAKIAAQGDLVDTLRLSGQFNTFLKGVDATNLTGLLKANKNLTVFAPTDAAFASMPPAELAHLQSDKTAMQKFILHHVVNAPVPSSKIKGAKGPVPTGAQDQVVLDGSDESGALHVDGATIVQADLQTTSGLVHVVDHVLEPGGAPATAAASSGTAAPAAATTATPK